ncbi:hypothetical protein G8A07_03205 [Roseateles sp. DAIF2]|uniref:hypothetical protein n=1 Tax=Roseateles sp. DAIF2 TaxID=2714952 RepID=UPI0018A2D9CF|nr:hypothetical protein [Roseateles sp. DAIF2]QPF72036.1 hypothetical protein G8A07_03205 [Roseateles sp. DAIF2]
MKRPILLTLAALAAFYAHARLSFAEPKVASWLVQHSARAMSGDSAACDDYVDQVEVNLIADGRRGKWEVEGGKEEMCGYLKQAAAAFTVLQARTHSEFDEIRIVREGFPWTSARVSYSQRMTVQADGLPAMTVKGEDELVVVRTLTGLKIKSLKSRSSGGL